MWCVEEGEVGSHYVVWRGGEGRFTLCREWRGEKVGSHYVVCGGGEGRFT